MRQAVDLTLAQHVLALGNVEDHLVVCVLVRHDLLEHKHALAKEPLCVVVLVEKVLEGVILDHGHGRVMLVLLVAALLRPAALLPMFLEDGCGGGSAAALHCGPRAPSPARSPAGGCAG